MKTNAKLQILKLGNIVSTGITETNLGKESKIVKGENNKREKNHTWKDDEKPKKWEKLKKRTAFLNQRLR